jgi:GTP pyrophosphokinase
MIYVLQTGEQVEILTGPTHAPKRDWLQPSLGYLKSSRARAKVQQWFKLQAREDNVSAGRALIEKMFKRLALTSLDYKAVCKRTGYQAVEEMYAAVGAGDISAQQILHAAQQLIDDTTDKEPELATVNLKKPSHNEKGVIVQGVGNLLTHFAGCCKPVRGDAIMGYVTLGRGVSVHRQDCSKMLQLQFNDPVRVIKVSWCEDEEQDTYPVDIQIEAYDRRGLLMDITTMLANAKVDVLASTTKTDKQKNTATMTLTLEVTGLEALGNLLARMNRLPNIISAVRIQEA